MKKAILTSLVVFFFGFVPVFSQEPEKAIEATVGYMTKIELKPLGDDPKIACVPPNKDWLTNVDFDGKKSIIFVPGKKSVVAPAKSKDFVFVISSNKGGKTQQDIYLVTVLPDGAPAPAPPGPPAPGPAPDTTDPLYSAYMVSPSEPGRLALIAAYKDFLANLQANKYTTNAAAAAELKMIVDTKVQQDIKKVREVAALELQKVQVAPYKADPLIAKVKDLIARLEKITLSSKKK